MNKIFQGSVAIRTMLGGLTIFFQLQISCSVYVPKIMKVGYHRQSYCNNNQQLSLLWAIRYIPRASKNCANLYFAPRLSNMNRFQ